MFSSLRHSAALLCAAVLLQSCASSAPLHAARNQFYSGQPEAAIETLSTEKISNRNRLLAYLDHGLIAHTAGNYNDSIKAFKSATALLDRINYIGVKEQTASLVTNDWVTAYKGEYSERLWIHTFQMMNFLLLGDPEGAAVEARQAVKVYEEYGDALQSDWYTRTLMAMSFEAAGKADSAHIEYKKMLDEISSDKGAARRAWQNARRLGRDQDAETFKNLITTSASTGGENGELIVFVQTGSIPRKVAGEIVVGPDLFTSFPMYPNIPRSNVHIDVVSGDGIDQQADIVTTQMVDVSRRALTARGTQIAAKQVLRLAAKKELADSIRRNTDSLAESFVGSFVTAALLISEVADTRSWETLPAQVSMVQIPLSSGQHDINLLVRHGSREYDIRLPNIDIEPRKITYRSVRAGSGAPKIVSPLTTIDPAITLPVKSDSLKSDIPTDTVKP